MSEVSRPLQVVLILAVGFAGLWFFALRPKTATGSSAPPPATQPARPAPHKSSLPGGLGRAVDKANAAKRQGDAEAAASDQAGSAPESGAPAQTASTSAPPPRPTAAIHATERTPGRPGGRP